MSLRPRFSLAALVMSLTLLVAPAMAFEILPYDQAVVAAKIKAGKPVVIHVFAPWCLQCRAQETILNRLSQKPGYEGVSFYRVDYDKQKDIVKAFDVPRSTLIVYKAGEQVALKSWGTNEKWVVDVLAAVE